MIGFITFALLAQLAPSHAQSSTDECAAQLSQSPRGNPRAACGAAISELIQSGLADGEVAQPIGGRIAGLAQFRQALDLARQLGDPTAQARILIHIGDVYHRVGRYPNALDAYEQAIQINQSGVSRPTVEAAALNGIGRVNTSFGRLSAAFEAHETALALFEAADLDAGQADTWRDLAAAYEEDVQWDQALAAYETARDIAQRVPDPGREAAAIHGIGEIHLAQNRLDAALEQYLAALAIRRDIADARGTQETLTRLGGAYHLKRQYDAAFSAYEEALNISRTRSDIAAEATLLQNMGLSYARSGDSDAALVKLYEAAALFDELGYRGLEGETLSQIGTILKVEGEIELAIALFKQSIAVLEEVRQDLRVLPLEQRSIFPQTFASTYRTLADLLLQQDRVAEAQQVLDLLKVQEVDDYLDDVPDADAAPLGEAALQPAETQLLALYDQTVADGRELAQLRRIPRSQRTPAQQDRIATLVTLQQNKRAEFNDFIESPEVKALVTELSDTSRQQNLNLQDLNSLQDNLQALDGAVLVYPLILPDRLELVVVTPYAPPLHRTVNVTDSEVKAAIETAREALTNRSRDPRSALQQLYRYLVEPIEADLAQANAQTLVYSPDGPLRYVPLGALHDGNQWLVERFSITNITAASLTDFARPSREGAGVGGLSILAAAFSEGAYSLQVGTRQVSLAGLPYAKVEVEALTDRFSNSTQLLNADFTRSTIVPQMDDYSVVHLATHAEFVSGRPEDSFILFGDGDQVTLRDVASWSLRNVDLVVLSACQTGLGGVLGSGEEILGFGYQIQRAGAKSAIASLWSVDDGGTQTLMTGFYNYLEQGYSKTEALRQAQIALINDDREVLDETQRGFSREFGGGSQTFSSSFSHPYYWSPFILIGSGQ
ncbi:MAG: CHAT domain-containing protein [Cyanobacteria bacterium J06632_22]